LFPFSGAADPSHTGGTDHADSAPPYQDPRRQGKPDRGKLTPCWYNKRDSHRVTGHPVPPLRLVLAPQFQCRRASFVFFSSQSKKRFDIFEHFDISLPENIQTVETWSNGRMEVVPALRAIAWTGGARTGDLREEGRGKNRPLPIPPTMERKLPPGQSIRKPSRTCLLNFSQHYPFILPSSLGTKKYRGRRTRDSSTRERCHRKSQHLCSGRQKISQWP